MLAVGVGAFQGAGVEERGGVGEAPLGAAGAQGVPAEAGGQLAGEPVDGVALGQCGLREDGGGSGTGRAVPGQASAGPEDSSGSGGSAPLRS